MINCTRQAPTRIRRRDWRSVKRHLPFFSRFGSVGRCDVRGCIPANVHSAWHSKTLGCQTLLWIDIDSACDSSISSAARIGGHGEWKEVGSGGSILAIVCEFACMFARVQLTLSSVKEATMYGIPSCAKREVCLSQYSRFLSWRLHNVLIPNCLLTNCRQLRYAQHSKWCPMPKLFSFVWVQRLLSYSWEEGRQRIHRHSDV